MTQASKNLGNKGEDLACEYLLKNNYRILGRNVRCKYGEIDIIAKDRDYIVIIEVKTKTNFSYGRPEEMVNHFKIKKLRLLSRFVLQSYPQEKLRIDVIAIDFTALIPCVNHIKNAIEMI